uniref:Uncharacterized protein n=1 Tax=Opuntia streptacantha TaxID=393608 RepID=A0A7C9FGA1_OPUST
MKLVAYLNPLCGLVCCTPPSTVLLISLGLCPSYPPHPLYLSRVIPMAVVLTCKIMFPLLILLPNLQTHLCWMDSDLAILLTPLTPLDHPFLMPSNLAWEAMVVVST